jgi:hypothetical protein
VTIESFNEWKTRFDKGVSLRRMREEGEKLKALTAKEREEYKRIAARLTGGRVSPRLFGYRYEYFAFQDVNFLSATGTSLRLMLPYWKRELYRSM